MEESQQEENGIQKLTEEIKNLRLELKSSNEVIRDLTSTINKLKGNSALKPKHNDNRKSKIEKRTSETITKKW